MKKLRTAAATFAVMALAAAPIGVVSASNAQAGQHGNNSLVAYPASAAVTDWHTHHMLATSRMKGFHTRNVPEGSKIDTRLRVDSVNLPPLSLNHGCRRFYSGRGVVARVSGLCAKGPHPIRLRYAAWHLDHELTFKWRVA